MCRYVSPGYGDRPAPETEQALAQAALRAADDFDRTGDADMAIQRLRAAVGKYREGRDEGIAPVSGVYREGQGK